MTFQFTHCLRRISVFLAFLFLLSVGEVTGWAQSYGPPQIYYDQDGSGVLQFMGTGTDYNGNSADAYGQSGAVMVYVNFAGQVTDAFGNALGSYNGNYTFSVFNGAMTSVSADGNSFPGLSAGITVISYNLSDMSVQSSGSSIIGPCVNQNGAYLEKIISVTTATFYQTGSSPWYIYNGGDVFLDGRNSWPASNILPIPPQQVFIDGVAYNINGSYANVSGGAYTDSAFYGSNNVEIDRTFQSGTVSGDIVASNIPFDGGFTNFTGSFNPDTLALSGIPANIGISFTPPPAVPARGPAMMSWNGVLMKYFYTDTQGTNYYQDSTESYLAQNSVDNELTVSSPTYSATGFFGPTNSFIWFPDPSGNGYDYYMRNFVAQDANGNPVGLPTGVTVLMGNSSAASGYSLEMSNGSSIGSAYSFTRPDGSFGIKYVTLNYQTVDWVYSWGPLVEGPFALSNGLSNSPIYNFHYATGDVVVNDIAGWPASNFVPTRLYVNGVACVRTSTSGGSATYASFDSLYSVTLTWSWSTQFTGTVQVVHGTNTYTGAWDGSSAFTGLPVGISVTISQPKVTVAAGAYHTLMLNIDGTVSAWGDNSYGELGDGTNVNRASAVQVLGLGGITSVAAGFYHSLALKNDGSIWGWGANWSGQIGSGAGGSSNVPVGISLPTGAAAGISAGDGFSLALDQYGQVWAWGTNGDGELGSASLVKSSNPVQIPGLSNMVMVAAGDQFGVALKSDGTVWAWGANWYGQLGATAGGFNPTPTQVSGLSSIVNIAAGTGFALALDSSGNVWAWGANWSGQLGNNSTTNSHVPVQVQNVSNAISISAGGDLGLATTYTGAVYSWGANGRGQLGNNTTAANSLVGVQVRGASGTLTGISSITAGGEFGLAINSTGSVLAWGDNSAGQLGNGTTTNQRIANSATGYLPSAVVTGNTPFPLSYGVAAGLTHTLALKNDGTVWSFGGNSQGQLGLGTSNTQMLYPTQVPGLSQISEVAAAGYHSAALKNDGTVWVWGNNDNGQLGIGSYASISVPNEVAGVTNAVAVVAGDYDIFIIKSDGTVWGAGNNSFGILGNGTTTTSNTFVQVTGLTGVVGFAASDYFAVAVKNDGTVWTWGVNNDYQLGNGTTATYSSTPVAISGLTNVVAVAAYANATFALKSDGTVWAWGTGTLGNVSPFQTVNPVQVAGLGNIVGIAAGLDHVLALANNGTVWGWGIDDYFDLGAGGSSSTPQIINGLGPTLAVAAAHYRSFAVQSDGSVLALGDNNLGELGLGTNNNIENSAPASVIGLNLLGYATSKVVSPSGTILAGPNADITLEAQITANASSVTTVDFYSGNTLLGSAFASPFVYSWKNVPAGKYIVTAKTTTSAGLSATSAPTIVKVMRPGYDSIGAGGEFNSVLRSDGMVWSWGRNRFTITYGELGTGSLAPQSNVPAYVRGLDEVVEIADGGAFTLALRPDGTVWAWGENSAGQCGNSPITEITAPVQVVGLSQIVSITGGGIHSLALRNDGTVWAWGYNVNGQLGNGTTSPNSGTPVQVSGMGGVREAAAGEYHSLALKSDGTVWAWGANANGQLGNASTTDSSVPVQVSGLTGVVAIAAGYLHSLALKNDGTVWAWGANSYGQLGTGTTTDSNVPMQVSSLSGITAVAGGGDHSLAIKNDGTVWSWGDNEFGQLGNGSTTQGLTPVQTLGLKGVVAICGGTSHSVALDATGTVWAWGLNSCGEIGNGNVSNCLSPVQVGGLAGVIATAEGATHSLALHSDGSVWTWGSNSNGQLGNNSTVDSLAPVQVEGVSDAIAVSAGSNFSVALQSDGTVLTWGDNTYGELGDGTSLQRSYPAPIPTLDGIVAISAGTNYALALRFDGTVWAWGAGSYGQLGNGSVLNSSIPVQVGGLSGIAEIAAGGYHGLALRHIDGTVWAWGRNNDGQLGDGTTVDSANVTQVPVITTVVAIAAGSYHSLALKNNRTLTQQILAWGNNASGQLGNNSTTNSATPVTAMTLTFPNLIGVAAGANHSIAYLGNGTVYLWGDNTTGEQGNNSTTNVLAPTAMSAISGGVLSISSGSQASYSLALGANGSLWGWGLNTSGQLENGTTINQLTPVSALGIGTPAGTGVAPVITLIQPIGAVMIH